MAALAAGAPRGVDLRAPAPDSPPPASRTEAAAPAPVLTGAAPFLDLDHDGVTDVIELAPTYSPTTPAVGRVSVRSGATGAALLDLTGQAPIDLFGYAAIPAGDLDGDGVCDIAVAAPAARWPESLAKQAAGNPSGQRDGPGAPVPMGRGLVHIFSGRDGSILRTLAGMPGERFGLALRAAAVEHHSASIVGLTAFSLFITGDRNVYMRQTKHDPATGELLFIEPDSEATAPDRAVYVAGDLDFDGRVGRSDLALMLVEIGRTCDAGCRVLADLDGDGAVTAADLANLLGAYGRSAAPCPELMETARRLDPDIGEADDANTPCAWWLWARFITEGAGVRGADTEDCNAYSAQPIFGGCENNEGGGSSPGGQPPLHPPTNPNPPRPPPPPGCQVSIEGCPAGPYLTLPSDGSPLLIHLSAVASGAGEFFWSTGDVGPETVAEITEPGPTTVTVVFTAADGQSCTDMCEIRVVGFDLDVDSDNSEDYAAPDRSFEEDDVEDVQGDPDAPGKVILVSNHDWDNDAVAGFADGYDLNPLILQDDRDESARFVPLVLDVQGIKGTDGRVRISYDASDPLLVEWRTGGWSLPPGSLRLWTVDGDEARDGRPVADGGHYVPPGEHALIDLGGPGPLTLFVEAVRPSAGIADKRILVELDPDSKGPTGYMLADAVRLTGVMVELLGRGAGEAFQPLPGPLAMNEYDLANPPAPETIPLNHRPFVHIYRVHDPRDLSGVSFWLENTALPLTNNGGWWETPEFWVDAPPYEGDGLPSPADSAVRVPIGGDSTQWSYNPEARVKRLKVTPAGETDTLFAEALDAAVEEMRADQSNSWRANYPPNDDGAFGKEVHRRMALRMQGRPGWLSSVWVNDATREIVSIGPPPPGALNGFTEIDLLRLRPGQSLAVGQTYNHDLVEELFEIKTSSQGQIAPGQRERLLRLTNHQPFKLSTPKHRFTSGWSDHPTGGKMWKIMTALGVASTAYALLGRSDHQELADEVVRKYDRYVVESLDPLQGPAAAHEFGVALGNFLTARTGQDFSQQTAYIATIIHLRLAAGQ